MKLSGCAVSKEKVTDWCRQNVMRSKVRVATGEGIADLQKATVG